MQSFTQLQSTQLPAPRPRRVLVTGASGFLGAAVVQKLRELDVPFVGACRRVDDVPVDVRQSFISVDLCGDSLPPGLFEGVDTIIHSAGLAHQFGANANDVGAFQRLNVDATQRLVREAIASGVQHFVLISSVSVYGGADGDDVQVDEESPCQPKTPYAISKYQGEQVAVALASNSRMRLTVLRLATIYGEGDRGNTDRLMRAIHRKRFVSIGAGQNQKSLIHVQDASRACMATLGLPLKDSPSSKSNVAIFNVSAPPVKMAQVIDGLTSGLGRAPASFYVPAWPVRFGLGTLATLTGEQSLFGRLQSTISKWLRSDIVDGSKFAKHFRFDCEVSIEQGLARQAADFLRRESSMRRFHAGKRCFDIVLAFLLMVATAIPMLLCFLAVRLTSPGPAVYWSERVGARQRPFWMAKFRSMRTDTPTVATHLLSDSKSYITPVGRLLRKTSLDELPQLWNVLVGQMSFVGPRPALVSQVVVNTLREERGVSEWMPGITGWAQVNGRDELVCQEKVEFDYQYTRRWSLVFDLKIILQTAIKVFASEGIRQADDASAEQASIVFHGAASDVKTAITLAATAECLPVASLARDQLSVDFGDVRLVGLRPVIESSAVLKHLNASADQLLIVTDLDSRFTVPAEASVLRLSLDELTEDCRQLHVAMVVEGIRTGVSAARSLEQERANANV